MRSLTGEVGFDVSKLPPTPEDASKLDGYLATHELPDGVRTKTIQQTEYRVPSGKMTRDVEIVDGELPNDGANLLISLPVVLGTMALVGSLLLSVVYTSRGVGTTAAVGAGLLAGAGIGHAIGAGASNIFVHRD